MRIDEGNVVSYVNNTHFTFDAHVINEIFCLPNEGSDFCKPKTPSPIIDYEDLKRSSFGSLRSNSLSDFKMSYFTPMQTYYCQCSNPY